MYTPTSYRTDFHNQRVRHGREVEDKVFRYLWDKGYDVEYSTEHDDIHLDIDLRVLNTNGTYRTISVKSQDAALRTGNVAFEIEQYDTKMDKWVPSWFYNGKADTYLFVIDNTIYKVEKSKLLVYIKHHGFDATKQLSPRTLASQSGRRYTDSRVGLIKLNTLISRGVFVKLGIMKTV